MSSSSAEGPPPPPAIDPAVASLVFRHLAKSAAEAYVPLRKYVCAHRGLPAAQADTITIGDVLATAKTLLQILPHAPAPGQRATRKKTAAQKRAILGKLDEREATVACVFLDSWRGHCLAMAALARNDATKGVQRQWHAEFATAWRLYEQREKADADQGAEQDAQTQQCAEDSSGDRGTEAVAEPATA